MTTLDASMQRSATIDAPIDEVWAVLADVERLGDLMPDVRDYEQVDEGWRWVLEGRQVLGHHIRPAFTVRYQPDPPTELAFETVQPSSDHGDADGAFRLVDREGATEVTMRLDLRLDVRLPGFLAGTARSTLRDELDRLGAGFLDNLRETVTGG